MKTKIALFRKQLDITQAELAETVGVNRQVIIALEKGRYNPSLDLSSKITKALNQKKISDVFMINS